jgi:hypothetical protein
MASGHVDGPDALLAEATRAGNAAAVRALLADGRADPAADDSIVLRRAAAIGHVDVLQALLADGRADPAARNSEALLNAAYNGHVDVMRALLIDGRADPAADGSAALQYNTYHGDVYGRADADPDGAVAAAAFYGRVDSAPNPYVTLLALLLADERVDATSPLVAALAVVEYAEDHVAHCVQLRLRWLRRRTWLRAGGASLG